MSLVATPVDLQYLFSHLSNLSPNDYAIIERAYLKAEAAHHGQMRKSGEPFFTHCFAVALILAEMKLDAEAIAAALMHDIVEDTPVTLDELRTEFGDTIAMMVDSVTKLKNLPLPTEKQNTGKRSRTINRELEYFRKMLMTMGDDIRVVLIKLADRLHNMRTLGYMAEAKQKMIAKETLEIFAPLANRLGIWKIKWELEDLSLRYLEPEVYRGIATQIDERRADRERYMHEVEQQLRLELERDGLQAHISGRPKHIYSIHNKMQRKQLPFDQIYDVRAIRVIVDNKAHCYQTLGIVHNLWHPIPGEFDDYIAGPKNNFYQSLHTAVIDNNGKVIEVQIRTWEMHEHAEYGIAAHWRYKEGTRDRDEIFENKVSYLRRLMEFGPDLSEDTEGYMDTVKNEVFQDRVYVFTPKGDIVDLPQGATPIDFAYHVHTEVGHRCRGAKIGGKLVNLNYELQSGDQVEIITSNRGGPSLDWLNEDSGYTKTQRARQKIKQWFRKLNRESHITLGRETLERELKRLALLDRFSFDEVAQIFDFNSVDDFFASIGAGDTTTAQISQHTFDEANRLQQEQESDAITVFKTRPRVAPLFDDDSHGVEIMGTDGLLTNIAPCCNPTPGDGIIGYVTRGRGVTVHRTTCTNIDRVRELEPNRLIQVSWAGSSEEQSYIIPVEVIAYDRGGLLKDLSTVIADEKVNITDVSVSTRQGIATVRLVLELHDSRQLTRIFGRIESIRSVTEVYRCNT